MFWLKNEKSYCLDETGSGLLAPSPTSVPINLLRVPNWNIRKCEVGLGGIPEIQGILHGL